MNATLLIKRTLIINIAWLFTLIMLAIPLISPTIVSANVPSTTITLGPGGPDRTTAVPRAYFEYNTAGSTAYMYHCQLDNFGWDICPAGSRGYANVPNGQHTFKVKAGKAYTDDNTGQTLYSWGPESAYTWTSAGEIREDITPGDISYGGSVFAVHTTSSTLVPNDTNGTTDVFVGTPNRGYTRASSTTTGTDANGPSFNPSLDNDGMIVAFETRSSNLVSGDTNAVQDVIVRNIADNTLNRVTNTAGAQIGPVGGIYSKKAAYQPSVSALGNKVAYTTEYGPSNNGGTLNNSKSDVYIYDINQKKSTVHIGEGREPSISGTGRYVAFTSDSKLLPHDGNGTSDVYMRDTHNNSLYLISVGTSGAQIGYVNQSPDISENGRYVAFESWGNNTSEGDSNGKSDIYVRDLALGKTIIISKNNNKSAIGNNDSFNPSISGMQRSDGSFSVSFETDADNLCTEYLCTDDNNKRDVMQWIGKDSTPDARIVTQSRKENSLISTNGTSSNSVMSSDGAFILFQSNALDSYTGNQHANRDTFMRGWWPYSVPDRTKLGDSIYPSEPTFPGVPPQQPNLPGPLPTSNQNGSAWSAAVGSLMGAKDVPPVSGQPNAGADDNDDVGRGIYGLHVLSGAYTGIAGMPTRITESEADQLTRDAVDKARAAQKNDYDACIARGIMSPDMCRKRARLVFRGVLADELDKARAIAIERTFCISSTVGRVNSGASPSKNWPYMR